ncbi:MAG: hypothetical protein NVSMB64_21490 [Candidatus Velthaea sp.]
MNRAEFVAAALAATVAPRPHAGSNVTAEIAIKRDAVDLLAPFTIAISLRNATGRIVPLDFPTADHYRIDVRRDELTVWSSSTGHKPIPIASRIDVPPGVMRLVNQILDGTTDDRRAYAPGRYTVRVAMLGSTLNTTLERTIDFAPPISVAEALKSKTGTVVTIAGTPFVEAGVVRIKDDSGTMRLSRSLGLRPAGRYIVRGYLDALGNDLQFAVGRFAPAFENVPEARPAPPS